MMGAALVGREAVSVLMDIARRAGGGAVAEGVPPPPADPAAAGRSAMLSRFDRAIDGANRLPRPLLAFGTLAMFAYAMIDPPRFAARMAGLQQVPEPLWWLLGGVVGFHFGAREAHYLRSRGAQPSPGLPAPPPAELPPVADTGRDGPLD